MNPYMLAWIVVLSGFLGWVAGLVTVAVLMIKKGPDWTADAIRKATDR